MTDEIDRPLDDVVLDAADADTTLSDDAKYLVMAALEGAEALSTLVGGGARPAARTTSESEAVRKPVGAFLTSIGVAGFRGIGARTVLDLHPAPGITIVSGRNGSGKSSFAEALEYAITGKSYRWENKAKLWRDTWRNLHESTPCEVRVGLTIEGSGPTVVGVDWAPDASLTDGTCWTQVGKAKRSSGLDALGWTSALEVHRPMLSYDEIGDVVQDSPSTLYDALAKLLGLNDIADAEKLLTDELKSAKGPRAAATADLRAVKLTVETCDDDRARAAGALLKKRTVDVDAVLALATGSASTVPPSVDRLRALADLSTPEQKDVDVAVATLRAAVSATVDDAAEALSVVQQRNELLGAALRLHGETGTTLCPVCETGTLDDAWAEHARAVLDEENNKLAQYRQGRKNLDDAHRAAQHLLLDVVEVEPIEGVELETLSAYRDAATAASEGPDRVAELADHLSTVLPKVRSAASTLREEAAAMLAQREDTWAPIAGALASWVQLETTARASDGMVASLDEAKKWLGGRASELRAQRLEPIAEHAREIWSELRQESNVDIGSISLQGTSTRRKAVLMGSVDGVESQALSVMSQGELHALALALFIPRATTPNSPFRFLVLDDPIQAMDPAKIDGFIRVLATLAQTRQVVVFSHDDRLAAAIRHLAVDARLVEVTRETGSHITVAETMNQATRYGEDAWALVRDEDVPDAIKRRVVPGLFRLALESAAQQLFYATQHKAGRIRTEIEDEWSATTTTRKKLALAVHGDAAADITGWLGYRAERWPTLKIANAGSHGEHVVVDSAAVKDLEKMVVGMLSA